MFQTGELIFYGRTGVCRVAAVEEEAGRCFYRLEPLYQRCSIRTPADGKIPLRPILRRAEAEALIDRLPSLDAKPQDGKALRELTAGYRDAIASPEPEGLALLAMSIYAKKQSLLKEKRKLGAIDERFMKEAESLLFGELSAALEIPLEEVPQYIQTRLEKN